MFSWFRKQPSPQRQTAERLYTGVVVRSRNPFFYERLGVPDTVNGRFDMILLHSFCVINALNKQGQGGRELAQALYDVMFVDMDRSVREMGVGDLSVGKHVRRMMKAFNGRMHAYQAGIDNASLDDALTRNLYGTVKGPVDPTHLAIMGDYIRNQVAALNTMNPDRLMQGDIEWAPVPGAGIKQRAPIVEPQKTDQAVA